MSVIFVFGLLVFSNISVPKYRPSTPRASLLLTEKAYKNTKNVRKAPLVPSADFADYPLQTLRAPITKAHH